MIHVRVRDDVQYSINDGTMVKYNYWGKWHYNPAHDAIISMSCFRHPPAIPAQATNLPQGDTPAHVLGAW